jgi:Tfp pilus assembly protein FimT
MKQQKRITGDRRAESGKSIVEILTVVAIIVIISAIALPQLLASRRYSRTVGVSREIVAQIRYARQQAMSQRQVVTFRYDNSTKQIFIIDHQETGITYDTATNAMVVIGNSAGAANVNPDVILKTVVLTSTSLPASELSYGRPPGAAANALSDGVNMTALNGNQVNITFQPDGSVVDANGNAVNRAIFIYNSQAANTTACAISVLGAAGRVKLWRYSSGADAYFE